MKKKFVILLALLIFILPVCKKKVNTLPPYLRKGNPEYYINQAYMYLNQGQYVKSEENFKKALRIIPNHLKALNGLGIIYLQQKKLDKSESFFLKILKLDRYQVDANNFLGIIYTERGEYEKAKENFLIAANSPQYKTPENAYQNLALLEIKRGKTDSALRYIDKGLSKNRDFAGLYYLRGTIYDKKKLYRRALYNFKRALKLSKTKSFDLKISVARGYIKTGQKINALNLLEKMIAEAVNESQRELVRKLIRSLE